MDYPEMPAMDMEPPDERRACEFCGSITGAGCEECYWTDDEEVSTDE